MKRTTISLDDDLAAAMAREARRRSLSFSELARETLRSRFAPPIEDQLPFVNLGRSGQRHTARDMEQLMREEWAEA